MEYKISVIVPVYNTEKYLKKAVFSVIKQTIGFESIQLILCDDCSTDSSYSICEQFCNRYNNIVVLQTQENTGSAGEPRNLGINAAQAPYIMFLDSDDLLRPEACDLLYNAIGHNDCDLVSGNYQELHYNKKIREVLSNSDSHNSVYDIPEKALEFRKHINPFWTKIYRTDIIKQNGIFFENFAIAEDTVFITNYLVHCKKCMYIDSPVYLYRIRDDSLSRKISVKVIKDVIQGDTIIKKSLLSNGFDDYWNHYIADHISDYLDILANSNINDNELIDIIKLWYAEIQEASQAGVPPKTPYAEIIFEDVATEGQLLVVKHMLAIKKISSDKNRIIKEMTQSIGWKMITKINQILRK